MTTKFTPDRQPRRDDPNAAMTLWQIVLNLINWVNSAILSTYKAGTATVSVGATTAIVTHGLGSVAYRVLLTPTNADAGSRWWVSNKTSTQFQINLSAAAPSGGSLFDWRVEGD